MASVFDRIKVRAGDTDRSATWYRTQVNKLLVVRQQVNCLEKANYK